MTAAIAVARPGRWPVVASAVGAMAVVCGALVWADLAAALLVTVWALPVAAAAAIDAKTARLPDPIVMPGVVAVLAVAALADRLTPAFVGAVLLALPMLAVHLARPDGLGFGDVKFGLLLGAGLGAVAVPLVTVAFLTAAAIHALACSVGRRGNRLVPFGPALAVASGAVLTLGIWRLR